MKTFNSGSCDLPTFSSGSCNGFIPPPSVGLRHTGAPRTDKVVNASAFGPLKRKEYGFSVNPAVMPCPTCKKLKQGMMFLSWIIAALFIALIYQQR